jgi:TonB family protein
MSPSGKQAARALTIKGNIALYHDLTGVAELDYQQALTQAPPNTTDAALTMETYAKFLRGEGRDSEAEAQLAKAWPIRQAAVSAIASEGSHVDPSAFDSQGTYKFRSGNGGAPAMTASSALMNARSSQIVMKVGNGVSAPVLLSKMEPEYSPEALSAKYTGTVMLKVVIGADGTASDPQLMKSLGFGLDEKAVDAVLQWRFKPAQKDGAAVPVQATIEVNFRLL